MKLEARNLTKIYSGKKVVKDVSLNLKKGEIVGVTGLDGNGQDDFVKILAGVQEANGGAEAERE